MPYFRHANLNFYFEEQGSGLPMVFSHGLSGNVAQARELVGAIPGFRLIFYDNRGHGRTIDPGRASDLNFATIAEDVVALMDGLSIEKAIVGGVSMGAAIALSFCLKYPHRTYAAVLVRPAWLNEPAPPNLAMFPAIAGMIQEYGLHRARQVFKDSNFYKVWQEQYAPAADSMEALFQGPSPEAIAATFQALPASVPYQKADDLTHVQVPALIIGNRCDPIHPLEYAQALARALPNAQLKEIPSKAQGVEAHTAALRRHLRKFLASVGNLTETRSA